MTLISPDLSSGYCDISSDMAVCEQETTLADLLQLNLHCFEDEVRGIVDKAVKEMGMEKVLSELNSTWTGTETRIFNF